MKNWTSENVHAHMSVHSSDGVPVGHIATVYQDSFLVHKGYFFPKDHYIPYSAIAGIEENDVRLTLNESEFGDRLWEKRPDYEHHLGDPTQLFYDRGHGIHDPFDDTGPALPEQ